MAIWILIHKGNSRFMAGTVIGVSDKMPVPLSETELAAGMRWVAVSDATMDDITAFENKVGRRIVKGIKIPALFDKNNELVSKTKAQVLTAVQATDTLNLDKVS